ncbi:MAG: hypothetical protein KKB88_00475 [Nanoarchaeota archaeon]|nr:hypothetical protein [Nanoarchaeota archaeon]
MIKQCWKKVNSKGTRPYIVYRNGKVHSNFQNPKELKEKFKNIHKC